MLAQTVAFQVKAFEYRALMAQIIQKPPRAKQAAHSGSGRLPSWSITPRSHWLPRIETAKKYAEAKRLLEDVIAKHPKTPWADLAQDTLDRGFSVKLNEWHHNPKYAERAQVCTEVLSGWENGDEQARSSLLRTVLSKQRGRPISITATSPV